MLMDLLMAAKKIITSYSKKEIVKFKKKVKLSYLLFKLFYFYEKMHYVLRLNSFLFWDFLRIYDIQNLSCHHPSLVQVFILQLAKFAALNT